MRPRPFRLLRPETLEEALAARREWGDRSALLAGGQSLVPAMNAGRHRPEVVIDLKGIAGWGGVHADDTSLTIGALATHERVARLGAADLPTELAQVPEVARATAPHPVRVRGTVVGNLTAGFRGAAWPAVLGAYGARVGMRHVERGVAAVGVHEAPGLASEGWIATEIVVPAGHRIGRAEVRVRASGRSYRVTCAMAHHAGGGADVWLCGLTSSATHDRVEDLSDDDLTHLAQGRAGQVEASPRRTESGADPETDERDLWHAATRTVLRRARTELEENTR
ncbi:FAD binding domain-containing protein [Myceligenerans indicum]|uniref:FAD-binding PCMH-type domain-containing protein n=1 Tax=Myceligenerans indicum TaxID=2593663 RepID=A0ABS1LQP9_9MICO|nr:FAD binding domain-containing protein [Myceligenerans indicum]MBL0888358.1 hypothetical protein [Myceligenerans indicum]